MAHMKVTDLQVFWVYLAAILLCNVIPFTILNRISTFGGCFTFFVVVPAIAITYIVVYTARQWKDVLK